MTEQFLFYIWQYRLFDQQNLRTTTGETIQVLKPGELNSNAGPDFTNALIKIGDTTWAGNVEIHINASDWDAHKHSGNSNYDTIILHLVLDSDRIIHRKDGEAIPTLELKQKLNWGVYENYTSLLKSRQWIPCGADIARVPDLNRNLWLERLLIERMERKATEIAAYLLLNNNNLEEAFYFQLAKNFGFKVNSLPFEMLAKSTPLQVIAKHRSSLFQLEALLFGQAGLLDDEAEDDYTEQLQTEYHFLKSKFNLSPIPGHLWKFLRLRPVNFPSVRIAQFAALVHQSNALLSKISEAAKMEDLEDLFNVSTSPYWETHYRFGKPSQQRKKTLGKMAFENIVINSVVSMMFLLSKHRNDESYAERAMLFLEKISAENNTILSGFDSLGINAGNAAQGQSLIELKNNYCSKKLCLECGIGKWLLK